MKHIYTFVALAIPCSAITAQSIVIAAATPQTAIASVGAQTQTSTEPAGPLPLWSAVTASTTIAPAASASMWTIGEASAGKLSCQATIQCVAPAGGQATIGSTDYVLTLSMPFSTAVRPRIEFVMTAPSGTPIPAIGVDIHDDGAFEFTEQSPSPMVLPLLAIGTTPVFVRLRIGAALAVPGTLDAYLNFQVTPDSTSATEVLGSCMPSALDYVVQPRFDGDLDYTPVAFGQSFPILAVAFGLQAQSTVVGVSPAGPCLALPRLDVVTLASPGFETLPIPAALRPIRLWTQAATIFGGSVITSEAYMVLAN